MPTSATGNKRRRARRRQKRARDAGFSLVEVLAVLAIMSLMVGAVVANLPDRPSAMTQRADTVQATVTRFLDAGAVRGEMRALGVSRDGLSLFTHDGTEWTAAQTLAWPDDTRVTLERAGRTVWLTDTAEPTLLFEPYGAVPDFALQMQDRRATLRLAPDARGRIIIEATP